MDLDNISIGDGPHLVEASAGTGKTTWMVKTAVRLLLNEPGVPKVGGPDRLLAMTFTRAATAELKARLRAALQKRAAEERAASNQSDADPLENKQLAAVLASIDRLAITTIHGFCTGVLQEFALECAVPAGLRFVDDVSEYLADAVADEWRTLTWRESTESRIVVRALLGGDDTRWSPTALKYAAMTVRSGIDAVRPPRLASRAELTKPVQVAIAQVRALFDEPRLRAFQAKVRWKPKNGLAAIAIDELRDALDRIERGETIQLAPITRWARATVKDNVYGKDGKYDAVLAAEPILDAATALLEAEVLAEELLWQDAVLGVVDRLEATLSRLRIAGFDDMVAMVDRALRGPDGPRLRQVLSQRYDAVVVDEFQDTDWAQWRVFAEAFGAKPLVLVGDPKQSIYGFRGADISAYHEAKKAATPGRTHSLKKNYRADAALVAATNLLFVADQPFAVPAELLGYTPVTGARLEASLTGDAARAPLQIVEFGTTTIGSLEQEIPEFIAAEAARLLSLPGLLYTPKDGQPRPLKADDIAVLVADRYEAGRVLRALRKQGVLAVSASTGDITDSEAWSDLMRVIAAIEDPADDRAVRRALVTAFGGRSASELYDLVRDESAWRSQVDRLSEARRDWMRRGALVALMRLLADAQWQSVERLALLRDGERWLTDLRHIVGTMQEAEREGHRSPGAILAWGRRFAELSAGKSETRQQHLESDREAVQVTTVHSAKGLEWPIVFCGSLWRAPKDAKGIARIVRLTDNTRHVRLVSKPFDNEVVRDSELSEDLRLAYVALTRARARMYVVHARGRNQKKDGPLHHLLTTKYGAEPGAALALASGDVKELRYAELAREYPAVESSDAMPTNELAAVTQDIPTARTQSWSVSSFTALTRGAKQHTVAEDIGPVDIAEGEPPATVESLPSVDLLPRDAHSGNAIHAIFERLDFAKAKDPEHRDSLIADVLADFALPSPNASEALRREAEAQVRTMVMNTLESPIPGAGAPLLGVPLTQTLREWRFHLSASGLQTRALADAFAKAGAPWLATEYAPRLARIGQRALEGYLMGVLDLAVVIEGRWWIVDWKSNTLGSVAGDYTDAAYRAEMMDAHYVLQYHLYAVALHRFLRWRLGDAYDYERDFGGVGYAFVRGFTLGVPAWFTDRPSKALIEALDAAVGRRA